MGCLYLKVCLYFKAVFMTITGTQTAMEADWVYDAFTHRILMSNIYDSAMVGHYCPGNLLSPNHHSYQDSNIAMPDYTTNTSRRIRFSL